MKKHKRARRKRGGTRAANQRAWERVAGTRRRLDDTSGFIQEKVLETARALVEQVHEEWSVRTTGMLPGDTEQGWVDYWEKQVQCYEGVIQDVLRGRDISSVGRRERPLRPRRGQHDDPLVDRVLMATCTLLKKEVYWLRVNQAAERFRSVVRRAVEEACGKPGLGQSPGVALQFFTIPPAPPDIPPPPDDGLSEIELADIAELYRMAIWWMMADHSHQTAVCGTRFYLECPDGWYSAEVYTPEVGDEAAIEAAKRRLRGEGDLEVRVIDEGDPDEPVFMVLFFRQKPVDPQTHPLGLRFAERSPGTE
jgi:hypothetical protein